jgi:EAL domain-containing protein (putative c-di-GMP-specific phosphodiesterase class I)
MTHKLGLKVIAEGVETAAQRLSLLRQGCDEMQGYLLAPPVPAAELPALLRRLEAAVGA